MTHTIGKASAHGDTLSSTTRCLISGKVIDEKKERGADTVKSLDFNHVNLFKIGEKLNPISSHGKIDKELKSISTHGSVRVVTLVSEYLWEVADQGSRSYLDDFQVLSLSSVGYI
jgi:hypothetical protein